MQLKSVYRIVPHWFTCMQLLWKTATATTKTFETVVLFLHSQCSLLAGQALVRGTGIHLHTSSGRSQNHSCKWSPPATDSFFVCCGCPLKRASTVCGLDPRVYLENYLRKMSNVVGKNDRHWQSLAGNLTWAEQNDNAYPEGLGKDSNWQLDYELEISMKW